MDTHPKCFLPFLADTVDNETYVREVIIVMVLGRLPTSKLVFIARNLQSPKKNNKQELEPR